MMCKLRTREDIERITFRETTFCHMNYVQISMNYQKKIAHHKSYC